MSRLDQRVRAVHPTLSWRQVREAIEKSQVTIDGHVERDPGTKVASSAKVVLDINRPAKALIRAPFVILHEDDDILVLNKPAGLLSIPSSEEAGNTEDTVLKRVREYITFKRKHRSYVGMLHRLDRDTSGALAVALSKEAHAAGRELFKHHRFERHYLALVEGVPDPPEGTIHARISSGYRSGRRKLVDEEAPGLDASTDYLVRERLSGAALLELRLHTGRQHQIRLHLEKLGHPLIGERVYGGLPGTPLPARTSRAVFAPPPPGRGRASARQARPPAFAKGSAGKHASLPVAVKRNMLHAWTLSFPHPLTGALISVEAPLPNDFQRAMKRLGGTQ